MSRIFFLLVLTVSLGVSGPLAAAPEDDDAAGQGGAGSEPADDEPEAGEPGSDDGREGDPTPDDADGADDPEGGDDPDAQPPIIYPEEKPKKKRRYAPDPRPKDWVFDQDRYHRGEQTTLFVANMQAGGAPLYLGLDSIESIPIAPKGFSPVINDAFFLEIDSAIGFALGGAPFPNNMLMDLMIGVRYQVYIYEWLEPYVATRGGILFAFAGGARPIPRFGFGVGSFFRASDTFAFRVELGYPHLKIGFTVSL